MDIQERTVLVIASRLLHYPEDSFPNLEKEILECIDENMEKQDWREKGKSILAPLRSLSDKGRKEIYVSTFDLKSKLGLYLTAHEFGDSAKRGPALIKLQKNINEAGFEREKGELADYIPMLLEFLAVCPDKFDNERLVRRLAVALQYMCEHIADDNPYAPILHLLNNLVFPEPTQEEIENIKFEREEADLEELPYPIMYE
ncbi:nitrate reductase delta subunit [Salibacterium salarium]|uniref:nitrate reductase molybdenum cofactor assembly chaperone n=1 Tax=Salibacterium salarium TaxID=284579 RepID=UPI00277E2C4B|nr:nitrate reductase molybdenum cofactor assembly chaperone [Salibacterium salarium]MDQ0300343.1 nitrate reductase delta subunit [Salibacterium salarium]